MLPKLLFQEAEVTKSLSNLLKSHNIVSSEKRVIDYNELISSKIEKIKAEAEKGEVEADGFVSGLNAAVVESLIDTDEETASTMAPDTPETVDIEAIQEQAEEILSQAKEEAQSILEEANKQAEDIKESAYKASFAQGMDEGIERGKITAMAECEKLRIEMAQHEEELQREYKERYAKMESEIVDVVTEVFRKVTHVVSEDNKDIIIHLINQVLENAEFSHEFLIKVSKEDYPFMIDNQSKIYNASSQEMNINVIEDSSLEKGQCIVETDGGVFDCSLDIQLEELIKDIKLLSCM